MPLCSIVGCFLSGEVRAIAQLAKPTQLDSTEANRARRYGVPENISEKMGLKKQWP